MTKVRIFLDNNSTTPRDPEVIKHFALTESKYFGNSSSNHIYGWEAEEIIKISKEQISETLTCKETNIIFTSGATEANCLAISGYLNKDKLNKSCITSKIEHSSIIEPLIKLKNGGLSLDFFENDNCGYIITNQREPSFICLQIANNEIGTIQNLKALRENYPNSYIHCDLAQGLGKIKIKIDELNANSYSISAHKIHGPMGIGALIFRDNESLQQISPQIIGGGQQNNLRSGSMPTALISSLGLSCKIANENLQNDQIKISKLTSLFFEKLRGQINELILIGEQNFNKRLPGNLSLRIPGIKAKDLIQKLATKVAFSSGSACSANKNKTSHVLEAIQLSKEESEEVFRIGIGKYNTEEEILTSVALFANTVK